MTLTQCNLAVSLALVLFTVPASADPVVYLLGSSPSGPPQFGRMDLATGVFSPVGPVPSTIQYLVPGPAGSLLTMSFNGDLLSVDPASGATSVVGATGFADCSTPDTPTCGSHSELSLGSAGGTIYTTDFANNLYTVNPSTGRATLVGPTGILPVPFIPASTNPDGSFNFYDENLFGAGGNLYANFDAGIFNPATSVQTVVIPPALYRIDPSTGHATRVSSTDFGLITITNVNGTAYGFSGVTNNVVVLNVANGQTRVVSRIDSALSLVGGASPAPAVPEPGSIALSAIGLAALGIYSRRKRLG